MEMKRKKERVNTSLLLHEVLIYIKHVCVYSYI